MDREFFPPKVPVKSFSPPSSTPSQIPQLSSDLSQPKRLSVSKSQCLISLSEQGMTLEDLSFLTKF